VSQAAVYEVQPRGSADNPSQALQTSAEIGHHVGRVPGIPEQDDVAKFEAGMAVAEGDALHGSSLPDPEVAEEFDVPRMKPWRR
jgi:hypothetical protein